VNGRRAQAASQAGAGGVPQGGLSLGALAFNSQTATKPPPVARRSGVQKQFDEDVAVGNEFHKSQSKRDAEPRSNNGQTVTKLRQSNEEKSKEYVEKKMDHYDRDRSIAWQFRKDLQARAGMNANELRAAFRVSVEEMNDDKRKHAEQKVKRKAATSAAKAAGAKAVVAPSALAVSALPHEPSMVVKLAPTGGFGNRRKRLPRATDLGGLRAQFKLAGVARLQYRDDEGDWTELDSDAALVRAAWTTPLPRIRPQHPSVL
jgi:hypothetical protein